MLDLLELQVSRPFRLMTPFRFIFVMTHADGLPLPV